LRPSDATVAIHKARQARLTEWLKRSGLHACVIEDGEGSRSSAMRWLSGHPMDAHLFLFASGRSVLVPWDANMAAERAVVDEVIPSSEFKRSARVTVSSVLRSNGVEAAVGGPGARRRVEFQGRTSHTRYLELKDDLPGAEIVLRAEGFEGFIGDARMVKDAAEIAALERSAEITNAVIDAVEARLSAGPDGLTEMDMAHLVEAEALRRGADGVGFETLAAGPSRSWAIHSFPPYGGGPFAAPGLSILDFGVKGTGTRAT
jgi:Xaa-Pro dipeptidase